jgi:Asp-tRNA(Asn)/Glu-tRNA(Gln) amidotransferase C subunit
MREDILLSTNPDTILAQAPRREENYFAVPAILKN